MDDLPAAPSGHATPEFREAGLHGRVAAQEPLVRIQQADAVGDRVESGLPLLRRLLQGLLDPDALRDVSHGGDPVFSIHEPRFDLQGKPPAVFSDAFDPVGSGVAATDLFRDDVVVFFGNQYFDDIFPQQLFPAVTDHVGKRQVQVLHDAIAVDQNAFEGQVGKILEPSLAPRKGALGVPKACQRIFEFRHPAAQPLQFENQLRPGFLFVSHANTLMWTGESGSRFRTPAAHGFSAVPGGPVTRY